MRLDLRILLPVALVIIAVLIPSSASADSNGVVNCPDQFQPVPAFFVTKNQDHNGNMWVCTKGPQGSNGHFNTTDDKGYQLDSSTNTLYDDTTGWALWLPGYVIYDTAQVIDDTTTP